MEVFEISAEKLVALYPDLKCDACGRRLSASAGETWVKAGCGYFCQDCVRRGRHLTHPAARRAS
jgi:hypothetical protein